MLALHKTSTRFFPMALCICNKYRQKNLAAITLLLLLLSNNLSASSYGYPASYTPADLLSHLLKGEYNANQQSVKWPATPGDIHEFNAQLAENSVLYSFVDTTMAIQRENQKVYYAIFRTAAMITNEEGKFANANNCHVCGVNLGYVSYRIENDSIYVDKFRRNFATHGAFGSNSYSLSLINLGEGYELLRIDDPYDGMGIHSVATSFYQDGVLMLSMISKENNGGYREKKQKGYYEFNTSFVYDNNTQTITIRQTGYRMNEKSGKKIPINKTKTLIYDNYTLQF